MRRASGSIAASLVSLHTRFDPAAVVESHVELFDREARGIRQRAGLDIDDAPRPPAAGTASGPARREVHQAATGGCRLHAHDESNPLWRRSSADSNALEQLRQHGVRVEIRFGDCTRRA